MKVKDLMSKKVITVKEDDSFIHVCRLIFANKIGGVPVVDKNGKLVGIVSEKDLFLAVLPSMTDLIYHPRMKSYKYIQRRAKTVFDLKVKKIMNTSLITIKEDEDIGEALSQMILSRVQRLPVLNKKGNLVGIITRGDIFNDLLKEIK